MPGEGSPQTFFEILSHQEKMNWDDIYIMATDERIVPINSVRSNTGMIQRELIERIKIQW